MDRSQFRGNKNRIIVVEDLPILNILLYDNDIVNGIL